MSHIPPRFGACLLLFFLLISSGTNTLSQENKNSTAKSSKKASEPAPLQLNDTTASHEQRFFDDATLHAIQFLPDGRQGWAVGDEGVVWHTVDGGKIWARQPTGTRASLRSVCFLNANVGWIVGREETPAKGMSTGVVLYTRDGGVHWTRYFENQMPGLNCIRFLDGKVGFMMGDATSRFPTGLYKTITGGRTWQKVGGTRGTSWLDGDFESKNVGALVGEWSQMAKLRQKGVTGIEVEELEGRSIRGIRMFGKKDSVAVGDGGLVLLSQTYGQGWSFAKNLKSVLSENMKKNLDFRAVDALAEQIWVVGRPGSVVLHSRDSGETWKIHKTNHPTPLNGIYFIDARRGWAVGELGSILVTKDGGRTWKVQRQGGRRTSLLFAHADARSVPLETMVQLGREEGHLISGIRVVAADSKSASRANVMEPNRFAAAVRMAGATTGETLWQFPLPEYFHDAKASEVMKYWNQLHDQEAPQQMLRQLVLALRMWRPNVVVTDGVSDKTTHTNTQHATRAIVQEAMRRAVKLAADPKQFPEQIRDLGLRPWEVSRVYSVWPSKKGSHVVIDAMQIGRRLMGAPQDIATVALPLVADRNDEIPASRFFKLVESTTKGAEDYRTLMAGLEGKADKGGRRFLRPFTQTDAYKKAIADHRALRNLIRNPKAGLSDPEKIIGQLKPILERLPLNAGAAAAYSIGRDYARKGQWILAQEIYLAMVQEYPWHPLTTSAYRWLVQHNTSSEVLRRYELRQYVKKGYGEWTKPLGMDGKNSAAKSQPKFNAHVQTTFLTNQAELKKQYTQSRVFAQKLWQMGPMFGQDPTILFSIQSMRRRVGEVIATDKWYRNYSEIHVKNPWQQAAAAEDWLTHRKGIPPKALVACIHSSKKPYLDGKFDDPCWKQFSATVLSNAVRTTRGTPGKSAYANTTQSHRTEVKLAYDHAFLYVALRCTHPAKDHVPPAKVRPRDADLNGFDRVRIMLDLDRDYSTYFCFEVDQRGCAREDCWGDPNWNPKWFIAMRSTKTSWNVEAAIPLAQLKGKRVEPGECWACNVVRVLPRRGVQALSTPAGPERQPEGMGLLLFEEHPANARQRSSTVVAPGDTLTPRRRK